CSRSAAKSFDGSLLMPAASSAALSLHAEEFSRGTRRQMRLVELAANPGPQSAHNKAPSGADASPHAAPPRQSGAPAVAVNPAPVCCTDTGTSPPSLRPSAITKAGTGEP